MNPLEAQATLLINKKMRQLLVYESKKKQTSNKNLLKEFTPSLRIQVVVHGKKVADIKMGETYKYYDLASLTKIIFTASVFMKLVDDKKIKLSDRISHHLAWWPYNRMTIEDVLSHSAGLSWWAPFYKEWIKNKKDVLNKKYLSREQVKRILVKTKIDETTLSQRKAVYSDLDIILLGFIIEEVCGQSLYEVWQKSTVKKKIPELHFNKNNKSIHAKSLYAPTEKCPWRKKVIRGEVHDDNTWSFGGVSTHAGLFGRIDDVTKFGLLLRQSYKNIKAGFLAKKKTVRKFTQRAIPAHRGDWALSFMLPTRGAASCGQYFDLTSFGHTGFVGTSLWYDPKKDLLITILSNRVYPTRKNNKFVKLRPLLHDSIVEALRKKHKL